MLIFKERPDINSCWCRLFEQIKYNAIHQSIKGVGLRESFLYVDMY